MAITDNLISYWELEEASGTRNDAHGTNHLTDVNTVTQATGKVANCSQHTYANQEYLSRTDNASLSLGAGVQFTFVAWVYPDPFINGIGILGKFNGSTIEYGFLCDSASGNFHFLCRNTADSAYGDLQATTAGPPSTGSWYFVMAQYNGSQLRISVNDGAVDTISYSGDAIDSNGDFVLGAWADAATRWSGRIDQVGFWKRALTSTEITFLYNGGAGRSYAALSGGGGGTVVQIAARAACASFVAGTIVYVLPELPRIYYDTTYVAPTGSVFTPADATAFQAALNSCNLGDEIRLTAGATYSGHFNLPAGKSGSGYVVIRSSATLTTEGVRITTAQAAGFPKLVTPDVSAVLVTANQASYYRFINVEFTSTSTPVNGSTIFLGDENNTIIADYPHHIILDRCYIHGHATNGARRGIMFCGSYQAVIDSYVSDYKEVGADTQAIAGWTGYGPYKVVNNYIEGAGENLLIGGSDTIIYNLTPSDIEISNNYFFKPLTWKVGDPSYLGVHWAVKNILELKHARRVLVQDNLFENNWADGQNGTAILFTVRNQIGGNPWATVEDVTFRNNELRNSGNGINCMGQDFESGVPSDHCRRCYIYDNVFTKIGGMTGGDGILFAVYSGYADITIDHNTTLHDPGVPGSGTIITVDYEPSLRLRFTNNIVQHSAYGITGSSGVGNPSIAHFLPASKITANVIQSDTNYSSIYPAGNYWPLYLKNPTTPGVNDVGFTNYPTDLSLAPTSPYHNAGTDGTDIGAVLGAPAGPTFQAVWAAGSNQMIAA